MEVREGMEVIFYTIFWISFLIFLAIIIFLPAFDGLERGKWRWEKRAIIPAALVIVLFTIYFFG